MMRSRSVHLAIWTLLYEQAMCDAGVQDRRLSTLATEGPEIALDTPDKACRVGAARASARKGRSGLGTPGFIYGRHADDSSVSVPLSLLAYPSHTCVPCDDRAS